MLKTQATNLCKRLCFSQLLKRLPVSSHLMQPFVAGPMPNWAEAPFYKDYLADSTTLFATQMFLMNWAEVRRWQDIKKPGSVSTDPLFEANKCTGTDVGYPGGGWFDPLNKGASTDVRV